MRAVLLGFAVGFTLLNPACGTDKRGEPGLADAGADPGTVAGADPGTGAGGASTTPSFGEPRSPMPSSSQSSPPASAPSTPQSTPSTGPMDTVSPSDGEPVANEDAGSQPAIISDDESVADSPAPSDATAPDLTSKPDAGTASSKTDATPSEPATPEYLDEFRLAVLGSSTAAGEGASDDDLGWVSLLEAALSTRTRELELANFAVGGYTSEELRPGSGAQGGIDDALEWGPNLVVIALAGSNDLSNGTSTQTLFSRLHAMRDAATEAGAVTFFLTTAPKDLGRDERELLKHWANEIEDQFGLCPVPGRDAEHAPCVIDAFAALANDSNGVASEYSAGDGIHLNDAGHERLFDVALPVIEPYVCANLRCE